VLPDPAWQERIRAGWAQFEADLAAYQHVEVLPAPVAAAVQDLPALSIRVDGQLTLNHNLVLFGERLQSFIADIDTNPSDDQAFADAEQAIKVMERAENALGAAEASALGQVSTVDEMVRTVASYKELARKTRLMLEKVVKARKETIRVEIQQAGKDKAAAHIAALNARLGKPYMPAIAVDFAGAMKGKKTVTSLRDAVDTELARFKIEANAVADRIQINLGTLRELASAHAFLFADTPSIVLKAADDLTALVKMRIAEHEQAEAAKAEALRARIAEEERVKAERPSARASPPKRSVNWTSRPPTWPRRAPSRKRQRGSGRRPAQTEPQNIPEIIPEPAPAAQVTPIDAARPQQLDDDADAAPRPDQRAPGAHHADGRRPGPPGLRARATDKSAKLYRSRTSCASARRCSVISVPWLNRGQRDAYGLHQPDRGRAGLRAQGRRSLRPRAEAQHLYRRRDRARLLSGDPLGLGRGLRGRREAGRCARADELRGDSPPVPDGCPPMTGQRPCLWTVLHCREQDFQRFLGVDGEQAAARRVKEVCEISSRAELDRDAAAQARWDERIRRAYLNYQKQHPTNHQ
jgi:hypothetical protein